MIDLRVVLTEVAEQVPAAPTGWYGIGLGTAAVISAVGVILNNRRTKKVYKATNGVEAGTPPLPERMARLEGEMAAHRDETIRRFDRLEDALQDVLSHVHRRDGSHVGD